MPPAFAAAVLTDGTIVVSGRVADPARIGKAFHIFDAVGNQVGSYGFAETAVIPGESGFDYNWVTKAADGGFWSVTHRNAYTIAKWRRDGTMQRRLEVPSAHVGVGKPSTMGFSRERPTDPYVRSISEDAEGRLWVETVVADKNWRRGVVFHSERPGELGLLPDFINLDRAYDTVIDVIDPATSRLVASQRFDEAYSLLIGSSMIGHPIIQPDGTYQVKLVRLRLVGGAGK